MAGDLFGNEAGANVVDVAAFFDSSVIDGVAEIVAMGVLVSIGTSRDRGAVSISITWDGKRDREYFRRSDDAADYLRTAAKSLRGLGLGEFTGDLPPIKPPPRHRQKLA